MAVSFTQSAAFDFSHSPRQVRLNGKLTFSGSYATGGDTLNLGTIQYARSKYVPVAVFVSGTTGHAYGYVAGTNLTDGKIKVNTAAATELGAGAYPAGITGDTNIYCEVVLRKV